MDSVVTVPKTSNAKINWKSGPAIKQYFPFHDTLIYYISKNPISSKAYNKLIQCCKYFFNVNPILVVAHMFKPNGSTNKIDEKARICSKIDHEYKGRDNCCIEVDLNKLSSKVWLANMLVICVNLTPNFSKLLRQKFYRYEIVELYLWDSTIPFDNFKFLAQSVQKLDFFAGVKILYKDGKLVLLDKILETCPKIEKFCVNFWHPSFSSMLAASTLKDISKLQNLTNLKKFHMRFVPEIFDIQVVSDFLTKNFMDANVDLHFGFGLSDEYKFQLGAINDKIQELQIRNHCVSYQS